MFRQEKKREGLRGVLIPDATAQKDLKGVREQVKFKLKEKRDRKQGCGLHKLHR